MAKDKQQVSTNEVIPTQLLSVHYPKICGVTETGHVVAVETTVQQKQDPLFWSGLTKIKHEKLWLPLSKTKHQLLDNDWLAVS
ncbi:hypothetical protein ACFQ5M_00755 [Agrilactobacillus yilanensis]|uniref:Uncharacterized protein n=1 Tax=Agrilactobacillus yilanensis TaxID=2485997 RepID=A0ABW4J3X4_9LACO|nr:hypothetical protein [Agrilactobacillus yilanensis]